MALTETRDGGSSIDSRFCPRCNTMLPSYALFCSACGERIKKQESEEGQGYAGSWDEEAEEQALIDTVRRPALQFNGTQSYHSLKKPSSIVDIAYRKAVAMLAVEGEKISDDSRLIQRIRVLARLLWHRLREHSLLRNSIYIIGTSIATSVLGYFFWILAAHLYSAYEVGLGAALISAMTLAAVCANLGVGSALIQTLPLRKAGSEWSLTFNAGLAVVTIASMLSGTIMLIALPLVSKQFAIVGNHIVYAIFFFAGVPLIAISTVLDQVFIAERTAQHMLVRNASVSALKIPLMILPAVLLAGVGVGALAIFGSGVLAMAIMLIASMLLLVPRLGRAYRFFAARGIVGQVRAMLSSLTGNYFINLGGLAMAYLLPIVVSIRLSPEDNAYYYTTTSVSTFILMGAAAVSTSLFAEGSHAGGGLQRKVRSSIQIIALMLGPEIVICLLFGRYILSVFGTSYAQHGLLLLRIDAISSIPDAITSVYVSVLRVQRRLHIAALLNLSTTAVTVILSWILLPMIGIAGQGLAYLIAAGAGSLVAGIDYFLSIRRR